MFRHLLNDPNFLPITIIFIALVLVAIWQKLDRFFIPLALVYSLYVIITIVMSPDQKSQFELPMKEIVKVPVDTLNEVINKKESEFARLAEEVRLAEEARLATIEAARLNEDSVVSGLSVNSINICESINISLRKPVNAGKVFPMTLGRVYCYTAIQNTLSERTILYEWYFQGNYIDKIPVKVGRSNHWRSWTYKTIAKVQIGEWYVLIRDKETNIVLETAYFSISNE